VRTRAVSTGAKHLALDISQVKNKPNQYINKVEPSENVQKPEESPFECFGCSS